MAERTQYATHSTGPVRNKAQEERHAADEDIKRFTDTADVLGGETWEYPTGHSGTRSSWAVSLAMVGSFLLAGAGMTFGPRVLLWIGAGLFVALGVYSFAAHTWTDYTHDPQQRPKEKKLSL
jgi:hypothetical protein